MPEDNGDSSPRNESLLTGPVTADGVLLGQPSPLGCQPWPGPVSRPQGLLPSLTQPWAPLLQWQPGEGRSEAWVSMPGEVPHCAEKDGLALTCSLQIGKLGSGKGSWVLPGIVSVGHTHR